MSETPTTITLPITSDEEQAAAEAAVAQYAAEREAAKMAPLRAIVNAEGYQATIDGLNAIIDAGTWVGGETIAIHLRGAVQTMANLKAAAQ